MPPMAQFRKALAFGLVTALWLALGWCAAANADTPPDAIQSTALDHGFLGLYNLDFAGAQKDFASWQQLHPDDPVGPVSEAAGFLFSEFNRLGVLESQFYENDDAFADRPKLKPDPALRQNFAAAIKRAEDLSHARLAK